jgi:rhodanese-related sulfurtransferase
VIATAAGYLVGVFLPPPEPGVPALLTAARRQLERVTPEEAQRAHAAGALLIDTRTDVQRLHQGNIPGAIVIDRTVLEWRLDPTSEWRIPEAAGYDVAVMVICRQGYSSSLAAASLRQLGLRRATDVIGGVEGWIAAGLPITIDAADVRQ